jgi:hypothetical protein
MAAVEVNRIESEGDIDEEFHRDYTSTYEVITDNKLDGPRTARTASVAGVAIPGYGDPYVWGNDSDPFAWCRSLSSKLKSRKAHRRHWTITVTHSTRPKYRESSTPRENPLDEPPLIYGSFVQFRRPATKDKDGKSIINTVGEPFVPALERDDSRLSVVIEKNTSSISLTQWANFRDAVNSAAIWGLPTRTVKLIQWSWRLAYYAVSSVYVQHRLEFHINTDVYAMAEPGRGWDYNVLNQGYRYRVDCAKPIEKRVREIMDGRDQPRKGPTPLGQAGQILDLACGDTEFYKNYRVYNELDFHAISFIPDPLPGPFV